MEKLNLFISQIWRALEVQNNGEFNLIDKFYYDYMIFIPVAFTKRTSLQKLNSLFEITKEINHKIEFQDNDSCTITIKKLVRPYAAKMYNIYTLKLKERGSILVARGNFRWVPYRKWRQAY